MYTNTNEKISCKMLKNVKFKNKLNKNIFLTLCKKVFAVILSRKVNRIWFKYWGLPKLFLCVPKYLKFIVDCIYVGVCMHSKSTVQIVVGSFIS